MADAVCTAFEDNLINGEMLGGLTDDDFKEQLGLKPLQIRRVQHELAKLAALGA